MDFSIIIPVRNRSEEIKRCVAACYAQNYSAKDFEVVVVDNGSTDETARSAVQTGARVVSEPTPNRCLARNMGTKVARGRWIVFTDSDCEPSPEWLARLAEAEKKIEASGGKKIGAIAGAIVSGQSRSAVETYIAARKWIDQEKFLAGQGRFSPPFAATANLAIRADVFREVGEFDPALSIAGEDADWCWRAADRGWGIHFAPEAKVVHHHRATVGGMIRQAYNYGRGNADLFAKHRANWRARVWIEPRHYVWTMKGLLKSPLVFFAHASSWERSFAWFDFLSNSAQAGGRIRGAVEHKILVI